MKKMLLLLAVAVSVVACGNKKKAETPQVSLQNTRWILKAIDGVDVAYPNKEKPANMLLEEGTNKLSGYGACNRFFGSYECDGEGVIKISQLGSTRMACIETMEIETSFFGALERVDSYVIDGETLYLKSADAILLSFTVAKEE